MKVINYRQILPVAMDNEMVKNVAGRVLIGREDGANAEHQFRNTGDEIFTFVCLVPSKAPEL